MRKPLLLVLLIGLLPGLLSACVSFAETPGERFQKVMKEMAELCQSKKLIATDSRCILPKMQPADPLATEEGRFAHSIKIPNPVPEDSGYKPGMSPEQYFDHLCKTEAGEFIYKTVENVEGLYFMRPREQATDYHQEHLYALEDPYGYTDWEASRLPTIFVNPPWAAYSYLEAPLLSGAKPKIEGAKFRRFSGYAQEKSPMIEEEIKVLSSKYGVTWRGITRPYDRELGIAGGEMIILDLQNNEVLAVRRGFIRSEGVRNLTGTWWLTGHVCPKYEGKAFNKDGNFAHWFIVKALKPKNANSEGGK
ncbi:MAG: hypothetical protein Q8N04_15685 [Nitrospira sp.]|nr:hypothetical protein [Nitrospira sp.]